MEYKNVPLFFIEGMEGKKIELKVGKSQIQPFAVGRSSFTFIYYFLLWILEKPVLGVNSDAGPLGK